MLERLTQHKTVLLPVFTAILAFVGSLLGARFLLPVNVQFEQEKALLELRRSAYTEFFEGQARAYILRGYPNVAPEDRENRIRVAKAKFFVAVFSRKQTAEAMADYWDKHVMRPEPADSCVSRDKSLADALMYQRMRTELFGDAADQQIDADKMLILLYDCRLPK